MARNIKVKKNEENPETPEILAEAIIKISEGVEKLLRGPLKEDAIVVLLQNMMNGVGKTEIRLVLQNLAKLKSYWIKS